MKQFVNGALVCFIALQLFSPSISGGGSGADDLATNYLRDTANGLAELEFFADTIRTSDRSSNDLAKEWAGMAAEVRLKASKPIDAKIVEMLDNGATKEEFAELVRQSCQRWRKIGEAL